MGIREGEVLGRGGKGWEWVEGRGGDEGKWGRSRKLISSVHMHMHHCTCTTLPTLNWNENSCFRISAKM